MEPTNYDFFNPLLPFCSSPRADDHTFHLRPADAPELAHRQVVVKVLVWFW
jgi:hypothetical protein